VMVRPGGREGRPLFLDPEGPEIWVSVHSGSSSLISAKGSAATVGMVSTSMVVAEVEAVASRSAEVMVAGRSRLAGAWSVFRGVMKERVVAVARCEGGMLVVLVAWSSANSGRLVSWSLITH